MCPLLTTCRGRLQRLLYDWIPVYTGMVRGAPPIPHLQRNAGTCAGKENRGEVLSPVPAFTFNYLHQPSPAIQRPEVIETAVETVG